MKTEMHPNKIGVTRLTFAPLEICADSQSINANPIS